MISRSQFLRLAPAAALAGCATTAAATAPSPSRVEQNRANALAFAELVFNAKRIQQAFDTYVGATYTQHNPMVPDGREGAIMGLGFLTTQNPELSYRVHRTIAEGDLVVLHVEVKFNPGHRGEAIVDIFRFDEAGKIVEHWDVIQLVPETARNNNGMF